MCAPSLPLCIHLPFTYYNLLYTPCSVFLILHKCARRVRWRRASDTFWFANSWSSARWNLSHGGFVIAKTVGMKTVMGLLNDEWHLQLIVGLLQRGVFYYCCSFSSSVQFCISKHCSSFHLLSKLLPYRLLIFLAIVLIIMSVLKSSYLTRRYSNDSTY